jgi:aryl-alcohol dehydrogenase-like predicted oxidoreductase
VDRSLKRLGTVYLDVVFCHDIEYVTEDDVLAAVGVLIELVREKKVRYVGCSAYNLDRLVRVAELVKQQYGQPLDAVQAWGQLTLQNTRLEVEALPRFRAAGVNTIFCSSPLCVGLLRAGGVPIGTLGDWHPSPKDLRQAVKEASDWAESQGQKASTNKSKTSLILACNSVAELESNLQAIQTITQRSPSAQIRARDDIRDFTKINETILGKDQSYFATVRSILGSWIDYSFTSPEMEWDIHQKKMRPTSQDGPIDNVAHL